MPATGGLAAASKAPIQNPAVPRAVYTAAMQQLLPLLLLLQLLLRVPMLKPSAFI
jgi:hypothetical protein